jgi:hypothetical protein
MYRTWSTPCPEYLAFFHAPLFYTCTWGSSAAEILGWRVAIVAGSLLDACSTWGSSVVEILGQGLLHVAAQLAVAAPFVAPPFFLGHGVEAVARSTYPLGVAGACVGGDARFATLRNARRRYQRADELGYRGEEA